MAPSLRIPISVNTQQFEQQMGELGRITQTAVKQATKELVKLNAELALKGLQTGLPLLGLFTKELAKAAYQSGLLGKAMLGFARVALPIAAVVGTFEAIGAITDFARQKIEEFVKTQEKASAAGVSAEFFQRWVKGGEAIKLSIDDATAALQRFADAAKSKLGGSDVQKRLVELQEAGNPIDSKAFEGATGNQAKLEAFVAMVTKMRDAGLVLASIDLTDKFLGGKVAEAFRADAGYLDRLLESAKAIEATKLVSQEDINRAVDLTNRLEAAQKLLAEKWVPLQRELLKLGLDYNESWINFYQNVAATVSAATQLLGIFEKLGGQIEQLGKASFWTKLTEATGRLGLNTALPEEMKLTPGNLAGTGSQAQQALASGLKNPALVAAAQRQATEIQNLLRGDISKPPGAAAKPAAEAEGFYDRQNAQIEKHIALMTADGEAVGKSVGERERLRVEAQLYEALLRDGVTDTEKYAEAISNMAERAGAAAQKTAELNGALAKINQASQVLGSAVSTAFADAIVEGKKLDDVLKSLVNTLLKAAINSTIMSLFTPGAGQTASPLAKVFGFAGGTDYAPGGFAMVGEKGPELVHLPRGSQVIPADATRGMMGGGGAIYYSPAIDARGASVEAVARLAQIMEADRAAFASRTVAVVQQARRSRLPGI